MKIHDSAKIDGASNIQIDLYINLPMIRPIIGTGIIIAVTSVLKQFEIVYLTTSGGPGNKTTLLSVLMYNRLFNGMEHGYANALGILLMVTGIILVNSLIFLSNKHDSWEKCFFYCCSTLSKTKHCCGISSCFNGNYF